MRATGVTLRGWFMALCCMGLLSCGDRQSDSLSALATAGYSLDIQDYHRAAKSGDVEALRLFIQAGVRLDLRDAAGCTALFHAAHAAKEDAVGWLLGQGASVQVSGSGGSSVLHAAVTGGSARVVEELLRAGARPAANESLLTLAARLGHLEVCQMLLTEPGAALDEAFLEAVAAGRMAVTDYLLKRGADAFATRLPDGISALMLAAQNDHQVLLKYLLQNGANRFALDAEGRCAYRFAASAAAANCEPLLAQPVTLAERELGLVLDPTADSNLREVTMTAGIQAAASAGSDAGVRALSALPATLGPADLGTDVMARLRLLTVREAMAPVLVAAIQEQTATVLMLASGGSATVAAGQVIDHTGWRLLTVHQRPSDPERRVLPEWMYPHVELEHLASRARRIGLIAVPVRAGETCAMLGLEGRRGAFEARVGDKLHLTGALQTPWSVVAMSPAAVTFELSGRKVMIGPHGVVSEQR
jgi:hypothetical protein